MSKRSASRSSDREVMQHLSRSQIFKDYERAFSEAMGLPLNIRGHDSWSPAHHGKEDRDSLASILARFNKARAACLRAQTDASREPDSTTAHRTWFAGLSESAVPVYVGDHILGFLETAKWCSRTRLRNTSRPLPGSSARGATRRIGSSLSGLIFGRAFYRRTGIARCCGS
jgi:hypothetical protein